ncbi:MAG: radical SAM protein [Candidatus Aminicenantia bacterium]
MRKPQFLSEGIRHATINGHRFHLRLTDPTKENYLWIDGTQPPLVLDQVAAEFIAHLIDAMWKFQAGDGDESQKVIDYVVEKMHQKYAKRFSLRKITKERIRADLDRIFGTIMDIAEGSCPVEVGLPMKEIKSTKWIAPARMDLAITYRCQLNCGKCYTGGSKEMKELATEDWTKIYDILWKIGVPQIVFTGGEPTLREDLVQLVGEAEEFVTGLVTNGIKLAELAIPLRDASLDYIQVTIESNNSEIHNQMVGNGDAFEKTVVGIKKALSLGMEVITNTTLTTHNADTFIDLIKWGKEIGLKHMACNTIICSGRGIQYKKEEGLSHEALKKLLAQALELADSLGIELQWYSPTCYLELNPIELGFGMKGCSAAAHNMTIQPDGTVIPCQSWPETIGNVLKDDWKSIWKHPTSRKLRKHELIAEKCKDCEYLATCGGGCPLEHINK